ncbi:unnamed protein product, partial [Amoebophrya sp. A25]
PDTLRGVPPGFVRVAFDNEAYHRNMVSNVRLQALRLDSAYSATKSKRDRDGEDRRSLEERLGNGKMAASASSDMRGADGVTRDQGGAESSTRRISRHDTRRSSWTSDISNDFLTTSDAFFTRKPQPTGEAVAIGRFVRVRT